MSLPWATCSRASGHLDANRSAGTLEPLVYLTSKEKFTLPLALTQYTDAYGTHLWNVQLAASATTVIPVLVVFVIAQRQFVEGLSQTGLKG